MTAMAEAASSSSLRIRCGGGNQMASDRPVSVAISGDFDSRRGKARKSMAAAALGIRCRGGNQIAPDRPVSAAISGEAFSGTAISRDADSRCGIGGMPMKTIAQNLSTRKKLKDQAVARENLDEWMRQSVVEIVKNLREAPLLVNVYPTRLETEKAKKENWVGVKEKWEKGESPAPEGIMFVEALNDKEAEEESSDRTWGVVVQRRGLECGPACYLLKTTRVGPCTHFCMVRVKSFRQSAASQLQDCWLCQGAKLAS